MAVGLVATTTVGLAAAPTRAETLTESCADVETVFARGSGQQPGGDQWKQWNEQLKLRITPPTSLHNYEIGLAYPAIAVAGATNILNGNTGGAKFGAGELFEYGRSVDQGVEQMFLFLRSRQERCPLSRFVMGGFSQGAQVVSETLELAEAAYPSLLTRVDFAAMFGDPKLHLPEGEGIFPAACRGENFSPWRRTVPNCQTDNGSLGPRKPYVPASMAGRAGLWCNNDDFVCGSSKNPLNTAGHTYFEPGGGIDEAVREIAGRLKETLPADRSAGVDPRILVIGEGTTGLDVAFVIDTTGSMWGRIAGAKAFARDFAAQIAELRGRVALIAYKDAGDAYTAGVFSGLSSDTAHFQTQLDSLSVGGGGDTPEALLHALTTTFNGLEWRPGATKAAVVLTDAGFHVPDRVDGSTVDSVARRSLEIDPVNVYPVVPSYLVSTYADLAQRTSGQVILDSGDSAAALRNALTRLRNRPVPLLPQANYYGRPGESFTFDASRSYVLDSTIVRYDWDVDGDGRFESSTTEPRLRHVYPAAFDGVMQVRVTAADGGIANASAFVHVGTPPPDDGPAAPSDLRADAVGSTVRLSWQSADPRAEYWGITVNGVPVGLADRSTRSVELTDIERDKEVVLGVVGLTADRVLGDSATVVVPPQSSRSLPVLDIRPGSATNTVQTKSNGVVPVALLSTNDVNSTTLDLTTACFGDAEAPAERDCSEAHGRGHFEDADGDGRLDVVLHYEMKQTGIDAGDDRACLSGRLKDGSTFEVCDAIRTR